jgi:hypothetical protein
MTRIRRRKSTDHAAEPFETTSTAAANIADGPAPIIKSA